MGTKTYKINSKQQAVLLQTLKLRFEKNMHRHKSTEWKKIEEKLLKNPDKLWTLSEMENTGGEPDLVVFADDKQKYFFIDCSKESPKGRVSLCYDKKALDERKENKPKGSAVEMANAMGVELLTEELYRKLQEIDEFDLKTSSWIQTPAAIRKLGGAMFCDRRYDHVFVYHNGAQSYYAARGFRGFFTL